MPSFSSDRYKLPLKISFLSHYSAVKCASSSLLSAKNRHRNEAEKDGGDEQMRVLKRPRFVHSLNPTDAKCNIARIFISYITTKFKDLSRHCLSKPGNIDYCTKWAEISNLFVKNRLYRIKAAKYLRTRFYVTKLFLCGWTNPFRTF